MKYVVKIDCLYPNPGDPTKTIAVGSENWFRWLAHHDRFVYQGENERFTARREVRRGSYYWYGYRKRMGKLHKVYLGKASDLTLDKLIAANTKVTGLEEADALSKHTSLLDLDTLLRTAVAGAAHLEGSAATNVPFALMTRLTPPALPANLVARPRLIQQINTPITLITAPSGFGKTTLLNQWRQQCPSPVAWVSLDTEENNTYTFWTIITVALQQIDPTIADTISILLQSPTPPPIEQIIACLIHNLNRWQTAQSRHLALIIDNYQRVRAPEIDATCQFFLDHLPEAVQVIIAGQVQFPFALQRWRGKGILTELTLDDLRLTPDEGVAWLERAVSIPLTAREKLSLVLRVEGWGAGLNLLALVLKKRDEVHRFIATFDGHHPYLQEYFVEEILRKHPPDRQAFLLQTSILKNLNWQLCDAVTERTGSEQILQHLYLANQFVMLVDEARGWYQYHNLFARALQDQLQQHFPHQTPDLHRRAAAWYQENELYSEAIHHLLLAGAWPEVAHLIEQVVLDELRRGSDHRILKWMQRLPDELFLRHETLLLTYARLATPSLPRGQVTGLLNRIATRIEAKPAAARTSSEQALLAKLIDWERTVTMGCSPHTAESPSNDIEQLWYMLDLIDHAYRLMRQGQIAASETVLSQAIEAGKAKGLLFIVMFAGGTQAGIIAGQGRLRQGEALARDILQWALAQTGSLPASASIPLTVLGRIYYDCNQIAQARQFIDDAVMIDPNPTSVNMIIHHHEFLARILNAQGDRMAAHAALQAALELEPCAPSVFIVQALKVRQALLYVRQGKVLAADRLLRQVSRYPLPAHQAGDGLLKAAWAELFLARQQYQDAEAILTQTGETRIDPFGFNVLPYTNLLLALAYWGQHRVNQARREMMRAIRIAEPEGIIRPFLDCSLQIIPLLTVVLHTGKLSRVNRHFVTQLLDQLRAAYPDAPVPSPEEIAARSVSAQISPREQEILQLLDEGLDNKALAIRLVVTVSTVRTHLRNIYRKLGVNSRTQAIKRARELQLL